MRKTLLKEEKQSKIKLHYKIKPKQTMKKFIITLLFVGFSFAVKAQNLEAKIPSNSDVVVAMNGDRLLELVSITDFDKSYMGKSMLKGINRKREDKISSIEDVGININSKVYYFMQNTDSVAYNNFMFKLANREQFEATLNKRKLKEIKRENGFNIMEEYGSVSIWNDNMLVFVSSTKSKSYFDANKDRFMKDAEDDYEYKVYRNILKKWSLGYAKRLLTSNPSKSILSNSKYQSAKKKDAAATVWVRNYGEIITNLFKSVGGAGIYSTSYMMLGNKNFYGIEEISGNLFFEKDVARLSMDMSVTPEMEKSYKKMYGKKLNKKFFNHFDQNNALAFWSFSLDTEAMFNEYPNLVKRIYGGVMPSAKEEISVAADLFALLIDEEAIGNLLTGDMLFVLDAIGEKDVPYTTYEYDEDYNRKEVTKTKKEFAPDFTLMIGSKEKELLNRVYKLGIKHKLVKSDAGVFELVLPKKDMPFPMYSIVKDDILFLTTSKTRASNIVRNKTFSSSGKHSKLIKKNISTMYISGQEILAKIPENLFSKKEKEMATVFGKNFTEAYLTSSRMKGNKLTTEFKINTSGKNENSLKLLLNLINEMAERK